jgi:hypothetical protein
MPYKKLEDANPAILGIEPAVDLEQANAIAAMADAMTASDNPPENPWAAAIAQFKKGYQAKDGKWVKSEEMDSADMDDEPEPEPQLSAAERKANKQPLSMAEAKLIRKELHELRDLLKRKVKEAEPGAKEMDGKDIDAEKLAAFEKLFGEFKAMALELFAGQAPTTPAEPAPEAVKVEIEKAAEKAEGKPGKFHEGVSVSIAAAEVAKAVLLEEVNAGRLKETADNPRSPVVVDLQIIKPGPGNTRDNNFYPKDVLKRDAKVFEGADLFVTDHNSSERNERNKVGKIRNVVGFTEDGAPIGRAVIYDPDLAEKTRNRAAAGEMPTLECSILGDGKMSPGKVGDKEYNIVTEISRIDAVDFVSKAGAGGAAIKVAEAANSTAAQNQKAEEVIQIKPEQVQEALKNSGLPAASQARLSEAQYPTTDVLQAAIVKERNYVAQLTHSGEPAGLGGGNWNVTPTPLATPEQLKEAASKLQKKFFGR